MILFENNLLECLSEAGAYLIKLEFLVKYERILRVNFTVACHSYLHCKFHEKYSKFKRHRIASSIALICSTYEMLMTQAELRLQLFHHRPQVGWRGDIFDTKPFYSGEPAKLKHREPIVLVFWLSENLKIGRIVDWLAKLEHFRLGWVRKNIFLLKRSSLFKNNTYRPRRFCTIKKSAQSAYDRKRALLRND